MIPRFQRVELVKGDVCQTIPEYVAQKPELGISRLHLDMDVYEPTLTALKYLYPLVVLAELFYLMNMQWRVFFVKVLPLMSILKDIDPFNKIFIYFNTRRIFC